MTSIATINNRVGQEIFRMDEALWDRIVSTIGTNAYAKVGEYYATSDPAAYAVIAARVSHV